MRYRVLGKTGLQVSEIGFGAWGIGGSKEGYGSYGVTDDQESQRTLQASFDAGVTFYDTSDLYGHGHSERLIGMTLNHVRSRMVIASKAGFVGDRGDQDFSPSHIRTSLGESLKRLRTDYLDLYYLHSPPGDLLDVHPEVLATLQDLKKAGAIRAFGISVRSPEDGLHFVRKWDIPVLQVNLSVIDQRARENGLLDLCETSGVGFIGRTPLCYGFLTGKYSEGSVFDPRDHRSRRPLEQIALWAKAVQLFDSVVRNERQTPAQIALRFCLSCKGVSAVIPGMLTRAHVEENVPASDFGPLSQEALVEMEKIYQENSFFLENVKTN